MKNRRKKGFGNVQQTATAAPAIPPYPQTVPDKSRSLTLKETLEFSLLGVILTGGAVIVGRKWIKKAVSGSEQMRTLDDGSTATLAKQIKMAFENDGWWGTDKDKLRDALRAVPDKASFRKVMLSYQKLYNTSMLADMQKALKSSEYNEMLAILSAKPGHNGNNAPVKVTDLQTQEWAKRLKAAFDLTYGPFSSTDTDAVKAVFLEIPTQSVFAQVGDAYRTLYGDDLSQKLKSKLGYFDYDPVMKLITTKPTQ